MPPNHAKRGPHPGPSPEAAWDPLFLLSPLLEPRSFQEVLPQLLPQEHSPPRPACQGRTELMCFPLSCATGFRNWLLGSLRGLPSARRCQPAAQSPEQCPHGGLRPLPRSPDPAGRRRLSMLSGRFWGQGDCLLLCWHHRPAPGHSSWMFTLSPLISGPEQAPPGPHALPGTPPSAREISVIRFNHREPSHSPALRPVRGCV